jgi:tyrosyl-tRNA synthetase
MKLIRGGGLYLNNNKVEKEDAIFTKGDLIGGKVGVFRSGKKQYHLLKLE